VQHFSVLVFSDKKATFKGLKYLKMGRVKPKKVYTPGSGLDKGSPGVGRTRPFLKRGLRGSSTPRTSWNRPYISCGRRQ
jgi:hypothetical protein